MENSLPGGSRTLMNGSVLAAGGMMRVDRVTAPKDGHILIPGACEYVTLHGIRDLAEAIKLRILRWKIILAQDDV